jgi:hypothetical protein
MCGPNATNLLFPIKTLKVEAGSTVTFGASPQTRVADESKSTGPVRFPSDVGDGEWFKIAAVGAADGMNWDYSSKNMINMVCTSSSLERCQRL